MEREIKFAKNTVVVGVGKILTQAISFFLLPLYTSKLSTAEYGTIDLYQTYASIIMVFLFLQIDQALFRFLVESRQDKNKLRGTISTALFSCAAIDGILIIVGTVVGYSSQWKYLFYMIAALHILENMLQISRGIGDNLTYTVGNFINSTLLILLNIVCLVVFKMKSSGIFISMIISSLAAATFIFFRLGIMNMIHPQYYSKDLHKALLRYSIPLVPNAASGWVISASDRLILSLFCGVSTIGILTVSQKFSVAIFNVFCILNITWNEYVSMNVKHCNEVKFSEIKNIILSLFAAICLGAISVIPMIFGLLIDPSYSEAYYVIPLYIVGIFFNIGTNVITAFYIALKKTKDIAKTAIVAAGINILINLIFVSNIGIYAAALSTIVSFVLVFIWRALDISRIMDISWNKLEIISWLLISILTIFIYYSKLGIIYNIFNAIGISLCWLFFNKRNLHMILKTVIAMRNNDNL